MRPIMNASAPNPHKIRNRVPWVGKPVSVPMASLVPEIIDSAKPKKNKIIKVCSRRTSILRFFKMYIK
ncbi:hypothetical protein AZF37_05990 [endosymbiont 'TC1' of Trimyema compressum]|nr:hypothetical protein AZF37_05990 [endosymbiont 'TC1' of Trimyema compressum]